MEATAIDRARAPGFRQISDINIIEARHTGLDNGVPLYSVNAGTQEVIRLELIFRAGARYETKRLVAAATAALLTEGTRKSTAAELADRIDFYGAHLNADADGDWINLTLFTLNRHLEKTLEVIEEVLNEAAFPERELAVFKQNRKQKLAVNNEKVDYVARKKFNELLFGPHHPYGYFATAGNYDQLERNDLVDFCNNRMLPGLHAVIVAGMVNDTVIGQINRYLGKGKKPDTFADGAPVPSPGLTGKHFFRKEGAVQAAIRIGKKLIQRDHPDFPGMFVLNAILGGYFGSRLMSNIREDKGYTYGIGSGMASLSLEGMFYIVTEVGAGVCKPALSEIYAEIERLRSETVEPEEMELVRNYLMGTFLRSIDGPFALADRFKQILLSGLDYGYYRNYLTTVKTISPEQLRELAVRYLDPSSMLEVVGGEM